MAYAFNHGLDNWDMWLPTGKAARALGISADTLKRYALRDEILIEGTHWRRGPHRNSPITWNISACEEVLQWKGRMGGQRRENQVNI